MANSILKIEYYSNGQFKKSEGASIFASSNLQSTLQFKFASDLGKSAVVANILIPYPVGSALYGQHQVQSLFMIKKADPNGGYIYEAGLETPYLVTQGKAYINAQVFATNGHQVYSNSGNVITIGAEGYYIYYTTETIDGETINKLVLENINTGKVYFQQNEGLIVIDRKLVIIDTFIAHMDGDFDGTLVVETAVQVQNYQQVEFKITDSAPYYSDYPLTPEESYVVLKAIANISADVANKQDKDDANINSLGVDHTVVGNINSLLTRMGAAEGDIVTLQADVQTNTEDIDRLKNIITYGLNIVGTMTITSVDPSTDNLVPTDLILTQFIENKTGHPIQRGDGLFVYWNNCVAPDATALFFWNGTSFQRLDIEIHKAGNSIAGMVEGTYTNDLTGLANKLMVDITNGKIINIYKVNSTATDSVTLTSVMDYVKSMLIDGTTPAPSAVKDGNGNDIVATYLTKALGATKQEMYDYAMPKMLYDLNYPDYMNGLYKTENVSDTSYQKTVNSTSIGYTTLAVLTKTLDAPILLGKQNGVTNKLWIRMSASEQIKFRVTTEYIDDQNIMHQLAVEETPADYLIGNTNKLYIVDSVFSGLTTPITLPAGTIIYQTIEVFREVSTSVDFTLLCNTTNEAYMTLNKIGFVKYCLEDSPSAILDSDIINASIANDVLTVTHNASFDFQNGGSAAIITEQKLPVNNSANIYAMKLVMGSALIAYAQKKVVVDLLNTSDVTLLDGHSRRVKGIINSLTINQIASAGILVGQDFESELIFETSAAWTSLTDYTGANYTGDDCSGGAFVPQASSRYDIIYYNDTNDNLTNNFQAIVSKR